MSKCKIQAEKARNDGNVFFRNSKFCEALLEYNKSLCFSVVGSEDVALAYANRSAAYMNLKEYDLCLKNIELAKKSGYPNPKMKKLEIREAECKQAMETHQPDPYDDPENFFKLSYPPNKKLPCLAECLELRVDEKFGRHIITTQDLKTGDIIGLTEPTFRLFDKRARLHHCSYCAKSSIKMNLIPCSGCSEGEEN
jgi:SET and MYND domain-containing protein 4